MKKYFLLTAVAFVLPFEVQAQMDHSMHQGHSMTQEEPEKFVEPKERNMPADYHNVETDPKIGKPIVKVAKDGQEGAQKNFGVQQVHDDQIFYQVIGDRIEHRSQQGDNAILYDTQAWLGNDYNKVWLKAEGEYNTSKDQHEQTSFEALYSRNISSFWDLQAGLRHDFISEADDRDFAALGVQGLAPYWFEVEATSYVSDEGDISAVLEAEYDLLLSQRLI